MCLDNIQIAADYDLSAVGPADLSQILRLEISWPRGPTPR